jgi:hypothetical protein
MTASEKTVIGFAKQVAKGTPNVTDADFDYLLFREGGLAPANMNIPLDREVGGGSMPRNVIKAGVVTGGSLSFIPRPHSLGRLFHSLLGKDVATPDVPSSTTSHLFTHAADEFDTPWLTGRQAPGMLWGEQYPDMKVASLVLSWRAARFVEGEVTFLGAAAPAKVDTAQWAASTHVDGGPQFIAPLGKIEVPTASPLEVVSGAFAAQIAMPVDDHMVVGSYTPVTLDVIQRNYILSLVARVNDAALYTKMQFDPAGGSAWVADLLKEADIDLEFKSPVMAGGAIPYSFKIAANGEAAAAGDANIIWTARPLSFRAGQQITMAVTGTFVANTKAGQEPVAITLVNTTEAY